AQAKPASRSHAIRDDRRMGEMSSLWGCPRRYSGGGAALTLESVPARGPVFDGPLLAAVQSAARAPLTFPVPDVADRPATVGAAIVSGVAGRGHGGLVAARPVAEGERKKGSGA